MSIFFIGDLLNIILQKSGYLVTLNFSLVSRFHNSYYKNNRIHVDDVFERLFNVGFKNGQTIYWMNILINEFRNLGLLGSRARVKKYLVLEYLFRKSISILDFYWVEIFCKGLSNLTIHPHVPYYLLKHVLLKWNGDPIKMLVGYKCIQSALNISWKDLLYDSKMMLTSSIIKNNNIQEVNCHLKYIFSDFVITSQWKSICYIHDEIIKLSKNILSWPERSILLDSIKVLGYPILSAIVAKNIKIYPNLLDNLVILLESDPHFTNMRINIISHFESQELIMLSFNNQHCSNFFVTFICQKLVRIGEARAPDILKKVGIDFIDVLNCDSLISRPILISFLQNGFWRNLASPIGLLDLQHVYQIRKEYIIRILTRKSMNYRIAFCESLVINATASAITWFYKNILASHLTNDILICLHEEAKRFHMYLNLDVMKYMVDNGWKPTTKLFLIDDVQSRLSEFYNKYGCPKDDAHLEFLCGKPHSLLMKCLDNGYIITMDNLIQFLSCHMLGFSPNQNSALLAKLLKLSPTVDQLTLLILSLLSNSSSPRCYSVSCFMESITLILKYFPDIYLGSIDTFLDKIDASTISKYKISIGRFEVGMLIELVTRKFSKTV